MKWKLSSMVVGTALLGVAQASASPITYNIDIEADGYSVTGTLSTDGVIGTVNLTDIGNYDLNLSNGVSHFELVGNPANPNYDPPGFNSAAGFPTTPLGGTLMVGSATQLTFAFESTATLGNFL
jgi:hypothetical protein